ncbi:NAD(P)-dependent oxidoreductase [Candidatus Pacearchaeota archaeon]|nr:NAD(P)-dependent oxidoreductase [Candidatus Pacearchaeota archaeon]
MKILVTGGTGFIGSHLVEQLVKEGHKVKVLARESEKREETRELFERLKVEIATGDLADRESLKKAVERVEVIFHLAAIARPMAIPREEYFNINEKGTRNLLEVCRNKKIKKFVMMSSVSAVGQSRNGEPVNEKTECNPVDIYGESKLAQEKAAEEYFKNFKMPIVILRPPMVFGPRDFELLKLFKAVNRRFFPIRGNEKCMEFLYVGNLVEACILAMKKGKNGEKYHITNGEHYSINEIIQSIERAEGKRVIPISLPRWMMRGGGYFIELAGKIAGFHPPFRHDTIDWMTKKLWYSDMSKAGKELGYTPKFGLDEGTRITAEYYKNKGIIR